MSKSELDDFNAEEEKVVTKTSDQINWDGNSVIVQDAVCNLCDALFVAPTDRPPIFCPKCKQALKELIL